MKTIKLTDPVTVDGVVYDSLTMRKPKGRDLGKLPLNAEEMGDLFPFLASICDVEPIVIDALGADDLTELFAEAKPFLPTDRTAKAP